MIFNGIPSGISYCQTFCFFLISYYYQQCCDKILKPAFLWTITIYVINS